MRVALISDIHANLPALEAVLDDIAASDGSPPSTISATSSAMPHGRTRW
jgi:hypothetical protein